MGSYNVGLLSGEGGGLEQFLNFIGNLFDTHVASLPKTAFEARESNSASLFSKYTNGQVRPGILKISAENVTNFYCMYCGKEGSQPQQ